MELAPPAKSVLMYPGGKTRAVPILIKHLPRDLPRLVSPFIGGGSFEIAAAATGIAVHAYDGFEPIVNFWKQVLRHAPAIAARARQYHAGDRRDILSLVERYDDLPNDLERAAAMYIISRCAFSSLVMSRWVNPHHRVFRLKHINDSLATFTAPNLHVDHADFTDSIARHPGDFLYLDPPYDIPSASMYGKDGSHHARFPHKLLADTLLCRDNWMLSYNNCPRVRLNFDGYRYIQPRWTYSMRRFVDQTQQSNEVLIFSHDLDLPADYPRIGWSS